MDHASLFIDGVDDGEVVFLGVGGVLGVLVDDFAESEVSDFDEEFEVGFIEVLGVVVEVEVEGLVENLEKDIAGFEVTVDGLLGAHVGEASPDLVEDFPALDSAFFDGHFVDVGEVIGEREGAGDVVADEFHLDDDVEGDVLGCAAVAGDSLFDPPVVGDDDVFVHEGHGDGDLAEEFEVFDACGLFVEEVAVFGGDNFDGEDLVIDGAEAGVDSSEGAFLIFVGFFEDDELFAEGAILEDVCAVFFFVPDGEELEFQAHLGMLFELDVYLFHVKSFDERFCVSLGCFEVVDCAVLAVADIEVDEVLFVFEEELALWAFLVSDNLREAVVFGLSFLWFFCSGISGEVLDDFLVLI